MLFAVTDVQFWLPILYVDPDQLYCAKGTETICAHKLHQARRSWPIRVTIWGPNCPAAIAAGHSEGIERAPHIAP